MPEIGRVLLIDDDDSWRKVLRVSLELEGFDVEDAANGDQGISLALSTHPDVILLDIRLPGEADMAVLEALQADETLRAIPVVMLTSVPDEPAELRARELGAVAFVTKVVPFEDLLLVVRRAVHSP